MFLEKRILKKFILGAFLVMVPFQNSAFAMREGYENGKLVRFFFRDEVEQGHPFRCKDCSRDLPDIRAQLLSSGYAVSNCNGAHYKIEPRPNPPGPTAEDLARIAADHAREKARKAEQEARRKAEFEARKEEAVQKALAEVAKEIEQKQKLAREEQAKKFEQENAEYFEKLTKKYETEIQKSISSANDFCFPAHTLISVPDFNEEGKITHLKFVPISEIKVDDSVLSCDLSSLTCEISHVTQLFRNQASRLIELSIEEKTIQATPNPPFYVVGRKEWVKAQDLQLGDQLIDTEGNEHPIKAIQAIDGEFPVYNFEVEGHHTYYASGILVHNCNFIRNLPMPDVAVGLSTAVGAMSLGGAATLGGPIGVAAYVGSAAGLGYALHEATKTNEEAQGEGDSGGEKASKRFTEEQQALVDMAKKDKRTGITKGDMEAYKDLNKELGEKGFTEEDAVRGPEVHPNRPFGKNPHGHVGPVDHIPFKN